MTARTPVPKPPGTISVHEVYTLAEFQRRAGMNAHAMRAARRKGLRVVAVGRKRYVLGADWLVFLREQAAKEGADA